MAFSFLSYLISFQRYSRFLLLCKLGTDDGIRCDNMEVKTQIEKKGKHHSSSLLKAFHIHLFFNASIFHFIGTLRFKENKFVIYKFIGPQIFVASRALLKRPEKLNVPEKPFVKLSTRLFCKACLFICCKGNKNLK